jgi:rRNA maturation RNase YbeY
VPSAPPWLVIHVAHPTLTVHEDRLARLVEAVLAGERRTFDELGIVLADRATVLELNRAFLDRNEPTDVLAFLLEPDEGAGPLQGEVYVDLDTALERHAEFDASFEDEALRYVAHGMLHLLGHDDATPADREAMHRLEDRYLRHA